MAFRPFAARDSGRRLCTAYGDGLAQVFHLFPYIPSYSVAQALRICKKNSKKLTGGIPPVSFLGFT